MHQFASPARFTRLANILLPFLIAGCVVTLAYGVYEALLVSPADYQQGETVRIMYIHVPAAWMALGIYVIMGLASASFLIWRHPLADIIARQSAPLGAGFTLITLLTGSLWGKPMWGTWWVWDARLTSMLLLLFLYIGYIALSDAYAAIERGKKICAILAIIGLVNIPVIRFSVEWWNTLHQPASIIRSGGMAIHPDMLAPLFTMAVSFKLLYVIMLLIRTKAALNMQKVRRLRANYA